MEHELVVLYQQDPSTHDIVVEAFRPLAISVARRYFRHQEPLDDLVQVALVGLVQALGRFDTQRGSPFATYALPTMMGEVRRHYRDTGWAVHVTRSAQELAQKLTALERSQTEPLTAEWAANALGVTLEEVIDGRLAQRALRADSLDRPHSRDEEDAPKVVVAVEDDGYRAVENRATINQLTSKLPARERTILALRFGGELSQTEIGARVGVSQMHVSRIIRRTLNQLAAA